ncbi:hypothetical protein Dimus_027389 [Dionaea muscipula]
MAGTSRVAEVVSEGVSYGGGGGGAGGKFKKKPFRRHQATPYDRPPTTLRNPQKNGWLSRLVDPASKLITAGAHKFFTSVFRKRLLPPPQQHSSDGNEERRERNVEAASPENHSEAEQQAVKDHRSLEVPTDGDGIAELEQILREKNFTRSELDHLTSLLQSRTNGVPSGIGKETFEATHEENHAHHSRNMKVINGPALVNGIKPNVVTGATSTPALEMNVLEDDMASPVDLAKAYMASRSTKVSPSMSGVRSQAHRGDPLFSGSSFQLRSPSISLASKPSNSIGTHEKTVVIPRSRGKSAIYSMSRPLYSSVQPTLTYKGPGTAFDAGPSSSSLFQSAPENSQFNEPKKSVLKRRSSVLDNDFGSIGPIRRIRQKPNLVSSKSIILPVSGTSHSSLNYQVERMDGNLNNLSSMHNPSRSVEMGQRILQQLDKISPKEKPKEKNLKIASGKSPTELTPDMLHGSARRSLETVDSLKFLQCVQSNNNDRVAFNVVQDAPNSSHKKEDKGSENGPKDPRIPSDKFVSESPVEAALSIKPSLNTSNATNAAARKFDDPPKKRRAFQMSAHEDYVELEDDVHSNGDMPASLIEQKKDDSNMNSEVSTGGKKTHGVPNPPVLDDEASLQKTPLFPELKSSPVSVSNKTKETEHTVDVASVAENNNDFTSAAAPVSSPSSITGKPAMLSQTSESSKEDAAQQLNTIALATSLPPKSSDMMSPFSFTPPSSPTEVPRSKGKQISSSFFAVTSTPVALPTIPVPDKVDDKSHHDAVDMSIKEETTHSSSVAGLAATSLPFKMPVSSPSLSNGTIGTGSEAASTLSPVLFSDNSKKQNFSDGFTQSTSAAVASAMATVTASSATEIITEVGPIVAASSSGLSLTSSTPSPSIFKFRASEQTAASASQASTGFGTESTEQGLKPKESGFGSQSSPSFSVPSITANADTGFFGFKPSTSANGGSLLTSSTAGFNPFGSGSVFGSNSAGSSSTTVFGSNSAGSSSTTASLSSTSMSSSASISGTLGSSWPSSKPQIFNTAFNSATPVFSFGAAGSASVSANSSSPMVFGTTGASSSPAFSFSSASLASWNNLSSPQSSLGNTNSAFTFSSAPSNNNNDQMNMEDSMAEDSVQTSAPAVRAFSQSPLATLPSPTYVFGATAVQATSPFQFGGQPQVPAPNPSPFQHSGSMESNPGSFSLGAGGNDKTGRKIIKVRKQLRKR